MTRKPNPTDLDHEPLKPLPEPKAEILEEPQETAAPPDGQAPTPAEERYTPTSARLEGLTRLAWPLLALSVLLVFNFFFTPGFFHIEMRGGRLFGSLIDVLNRGTPVMLLALGMTLVIATGGVDLSVGAVMAIAGAIAASLITRPDYALLSVINVHGSITAVILIALVCATAAGLWNGLLVALLDIQPIVATLILMVAGRGVAQLLIDGQIITFENPAFEFLGGGFLFGLPFTIYIVGAAFALTAALVRGTAIGLFIESVGNNASASRLAGVNARRVKIFVYAFCGLCAGMAGLIATADIKASDANNVGLYLELDAILAVALGGTSLSGGGRFSLAGTLIGALLIQTLTTTILTRGISPMLTLVVKAAVIIAVCLLQSDSARALISRRGRKA